MAPPKNRPAYVHHRPTGQARVRFAGKDFYLGKFGTPESREKYEELVTAWLSDQDPRHVALTVDDLALLFLDFAKTYYRHRDGTETRSTNHFRQALRLVSCSTGEPSWLDDPNPGARFWPWGSSAGPEVDD